jgi:hypothetical protein
MQNLLDNVHKKASLIREKYYKNTLPWGMDGTMMLPTSNYLQFMNEFRKEKGEWIQLVDDFVAEYPQLVANASTMLGGLYDAADYPTASQIRDKFRMDMAVYPVPSSDFRVEIANDELSRIQHDVETRVKDAQQQAMQEVWQRLFDRVKHMAEKLSDPKAIFKNSMVEHATELCALLPRLNFADDPNLEALRKEVESKLIKHPEALRNDPDLRSDTAAEARRIMAAMGTFMGAQ